MSKLTLLPRANRVIVLPQTAEEKTQGGIYVPNKSDDKIIRGTVVAVGDGKVVDGKNLPVTLKVGQVVVFNQYAGSEIEHEDEKYIIISEEEVMAIVE